MIASNKTDSKPHLSRVSLLHRRLKTKNSNCKGLTVGVSVVIASYDGADRLGLLLESLVNQSLANSLLQVVLVVNGESAASSKVVKRVVAEHPELNLLLVETPVANLPKARNLGLKFADRQYVTFIDDDDLIEVDFLSQLYARAGEGRIVLGSMVDVLPGFTKIMASTIAQRFALLSDKVWDISEVSWALGFNSAKLVPTDLAKQFRYSENLSSGEDVVYFANFLSLRGLTLVASEGRDGSRYLRQLREKSLSRQKESFDFNVSQRIDCLTALQQIGVPEENSKALSQLVSAQMAFLYRYAEQHPDRVPEIGSSLMKANLTGVDWDDWLNRDVDTLVYAYCFWPFADTSAIVMSKKLLNAGGFYDVVSADMSTVRSLDTSMSLLLEPHIVNHEVVNVPVSFSAWRPQVEFARKANEAARQLAQQRGRQYRKIYSRALWAGSHLAGALHKLENPEVTWTAEFSDPLRTDAGGDLRVSDEPSGQVAEVLVEELRNVGITEAISTSFQLIELITLTLADEIVFTNQHQKSHMLRAYPPKIRSLVNGKSIIRAHPTPEPYMYSLKEPNYYVSPFQINIGYFGSFYPNRGLGEVLDVLNSASIPAGKKIVFHVFTNSPKALIESLSSVERSCLVVNDQVPYLEFLALCKVFDLLFIGDAETSSKMPENPFLPSKYSDYLGSGTKIWSHTEGGSSLDSLPATIRSTVGDRSTILEALLEISGTC